MNSENVRRKLMILEGMLRNCRLCPRRCEVDRTRGETGFCGLGTDVRIDGALPHHGEEPPLSGNGGAGTVFFSSCNLRCSFCQNYQISHGIHGRTAKSLDLAEVFLGLQRQGCHNIDLVTPTAQAPPILKAVAAARDMGLSVPIVYNSGGYEDPDVVALFDGCVNIYLPDFKYGSSRDAQIFSAAPDYPFWAVKAIGEMIRQTGPGLELDGDLAVQGIIIRHLVLPGGVKNSLEVLRLIRSRLSRYVPLSIMSQYTPTPTVQDHPLLGRRVMRKEYEAVVEAALDMGFDEIFVQEVDDRHCVPDFDRHEPFRWNEEQTDDDR
ncbi:MAG: radical SAM protein [Deltaproteobacteria bacterium]|nr:radical SAM protein [Deltaproteobacteria bacterium]